ncbi:MAG: ORC1-type DNA replication protein [Methanobacteriaceae archaeon]
MGIEDILLHDETIFRELNAFDPDYMPENYKYRDSQVDAMAMCVRPALKNSSPINSVILGSCATGKTTAMHKLFEVVEKTSEKVVCAYINCQIYTTRYGIFSQLHKKVFGYTPPDSGVPFSRIYEKIMEHLSKEKKSLVVALDDVDYLFHEKQANKIFYDILRAHEEYPGVRSSIFAITSDIEFRFALDRNVNTVFIPQEIKFPPYSREEFLTILKERCRIGFYEGVISDEIIEEVVDYSQENGDLRLGIDILRVAGNLAEAEASRKIEVEHLDKAIMTHIPSHLAETLKTLNILEKTVLELIMEAYPDNMTSGKLSEIFIKHTDSSYTKFNQIINKLEFLRLIDTQLTGKGVKGNSRVIILRFDVEKINKCIGLY